MLKPRRFLLLVFISLLAFVQESRSASWKLEGPLFGHVLSIAVDPANPDRLWVSTHGGGVWRSSDGGKSWQLSGAELSSSVVPFIVLQPKSNALWASVDKGALARSKDGEKSWEWIYDDL